MLGFLVRRVLGFLFSEFCDYLIFRKVYNDYPRKTGESDIYTLLVA